MWQSGLMHFSHKEDHVGSIPTITTNMFSSCNTTTDQGNVGEAYAIAYFTSVGYKVSKPLFVNCDYDFIVDDGVKLSRVQVKSTKHIRNENYVVGIKTSGSNARVTNIRPFDSVKVDLVCVLADNGNMWVIPAESITKRNEITLNESWDTYKVSIRGVGR